MITINISPIAFSIGPLEVRWYGIFVALAVMTVVVWTVWQVKKGAKISYDTVFAAALVGIPSGVIFSRLLHVIDQWEYFSQNPGQIIGGEGLTAWGAVLGAALGVWVYSKFAKMSFAYFADVIAPGVILSQAVGRVGCLFNGCCYGEETSLPWGIVYTNPESLCPVGIAFHPSQVYEIFWNLFVFAILFKMRGKLKPDGSLFALYLTLYSAWRLGSDFLRSGDTFLFGLHQAQVIAIVVLAIAIPWLVFRTRRKRPGETDSVES
jgi:phosphatidylglycerol:prolipoprotein diacylglycerol transferase